MNYNEIFGLNDEYEVFQYYNPRYFDMIPKEIPIQNLQNEGLFSGSKADFIGYVNSSELSSLTNCFQGTSNVEIIDMREWDLTNVNSLYSCFADSNAKVIIIGDHPECDKLEDMYWCFWGTQFRKIDFRGLDTSKVTNFDYLFGSCYNLYEVYGLDFSSAKNLNNVFAYGDVNLIHTDGFKNLKCNWNDNEGLAKFPYLTYESCINILNGLYDFTGNGEVPNSDEGVLKVHNAFIDLVGDEISIGLNKGWTILTN